MPTINPPTHHSGNSTKDTKNSHACMGLALSPLHGFHHGWSSSPGEGRDSDHGVGCTRGGLRGSRMWNCRLWEATDTEGARGATRADIGMEAPDMLLRDALEGARCTLGTYLRMDEGAYEAGRAERDGGRGRAFSSCGGSKIAAKGTVPAAVLRRLARLAVELVRACDERCWWWRCARDGGEGDDCSWW